MPSPHVWRRRTSRPSSSRPAAPPSSCSCGGFATPSRRRWAGGSRGRAIGGGIRNGQVRVVAATNALELGIDIGGLDAAVLLGFPGTLASTWQQVGRAGRGDRLAFSVLVTNSTPLNQYLAQHPDYLFETSPEAGFINPDNLVIRVSHLKCAAFELPFGRDEEFGPGSGELLDLLPGEGRP